jgi:putative peptide zinc metalloprotease protein
MHQKQALTALPPLREDIVLLQGDRTRDGAPSWLLYDPARHRYTRLDQDGFEILSRWDVGTPEALLAWLARETTIHATTEDIEAMAAFLDRAHLLDKCGTVTEMPPRTGPLKWLLHGYLFFRVPLIRPRRFLPTLSAVTGWLFGPQYVWFLLGLVVFGGFLVSRQWDAFIGTFTAYTTWAGAAALMAGIVVSKIIHELGHALTLYRAGGRVPTMGIAFLVMMPVPYTDTSDCWRLASKRNRLQVGAAGVAAELLLAAMALVLWSFVPDGPLRATLFVLATTVWVGTVLINVSPFMRFDGYYLLSDFLEVPNLQSRAFALARWRLRRSVLGQDQPPPEVFPPRLHRFLILYAYITWIYRLVLFLGIAFLVYHLFFKVLGILLFLVEIWAFIARPVAAELAVWWQSRHNANWSWGGVVTIGALAALVVLTVVPWRSTIQVPAILEASSASRVYPVSSARVEAVMVSAGQYVNVGDDLIRLSSPDLLFQKAKAVQELALAQVRYDNAMMDAEGIQEAAALRQSVMGLRTRIAGYVTEEKRLTLRAPTNGRVVDIPSFLRPGLWVNQGDSLGRVVTTRGGRLTLYIPESDLGQVRAGNSVVFRSSLTDDDDLHGKLGALPPVALDRVQDTLAASTGGGGVAVRQEADNTLRPIVGTYQAEVILPDVEVSQRRRGIALIEGDAQSLVSRLLQKIAAVFVQESGF